MNRHVPLTASILLVLCLAPSPGQACGESLLRVGQGLRYQVYQAKVPATVLVYAGATRPEVLAGLQRAGHHVTVARDAQALDQALLARRYDLVMVDSADADMVAAQLQRLAVHPDLVPVAARRETAKRSSHAEAIAATASIGQYLRRINLIMKART